MRKRETVRLTITAVFAAILIIQTFVPNIGYIRILPALPAITTIPLTIAIYSTLLGPKAGSLFGLFWGLTRLIVAYTQPGDLVSLMLFQNPIISLVPSIVAGFLPGWIAKITHRNKLAYVLSGASASISNTLLVICLTSLFFMNNSATLMKYLGNTNGSKSLFIVLLVALGGNGIAEAIFTAILTPVIAIPVHKALKRFNS